MVTCFNRDKDGRCMAYKKGRCHNHCKARIPTVEGKIALLTSLLSMAQSKKDKRELEKELEEATKAKATLDAGRFDQWMSCYMQDMHRGEGGGASEGDSSNRAKGMKQLMKDNRPVGVKPTKAQQEEYKAALKEFEDQVGEKMEKLGRTSMTHSRVDSYTGIPICFCDSGMGHCRGQRSAAGKLAKECRTCSFLKE